MDCVGIYNRMLEFRDKHYMLILFHIGRPTMRCGQIIGKLYNYCWEEIQDTRGLSYHWVLETWGTRARKHDLIMASAM